MSEGVCLGALSAIPLGESKGYRPDNEPQDRLFVIRLSVNTVVAYRNSCPHLGYESAPMAWRRDRYLDGSKQLIKCGSHGALFTLKEGKCVEGPCEGQQLTPERVTVDNNGNLIWWPHTEESNVMSESVKKVLIVGGGFTGMSAAILLQQQGVEVHLVELDKNWRTDGAGITVSGPSLRAIEQIGVLDEFKQYGAICQNVDMFTSNGTYLRQIPTPAVPGSSIVGGGGIMRPVLAKILAERTKKTGVKVLLGHTYESLDDKGDRVEVTFTNGESDSYDLVAAADGVFSKTRQLIFPDAPTPQYTGQVVWRAVVERHGLERPALFYGPNGKLGFTPVSATHMYLNYTEQQPQKKRLADDQLLPHLKGLIAEFTAPVIEKVKAELNENSSILARPLEGMIMARPWSKGRVLLMGDAVHATTPHLASGAGMGHEDAVVLADEVKAGGTVEDILKRFEDRRWTRCSLIVSNSKRLGEIEQTGGSKVEHMQIMALSMSALMAPI
ncbi:MAG: NAD-binding protein [Gammaproteobacteria bacterium]|nr:NAD-binding protein [Gammaproteobacteria bacterium]